ncbi:MAG: WD40 repeat domain-containing protein, partial [Okeania sp. SIO2F4]
MVWRAKFKLNESEALQKSVKSTILSTSGKDFEALLCTLRAVKQLPLPNLIFQLRDDSKTQITDFLRQLIYKNLRYRERNSLHDHEDWVNGLAFSPDGETIATASGDYTVKLWNRQGKLLQTLIGHEDWVNGVAFSRDGETIATAS